MVLAAYLLSLGASAISVPNDPDADRDGDDVPARGIEKYWVDSDRDLNDFILRIEPEDFARMAPGVDYQLAWVGKDEGLRWKISGGVKIAKPKR